MSEIQTRLQDNITSATALVVIGIGLVAMALSVPYFWLIFVVGLLVVVPLVGLLLGADDWRKWDPLSDEFWDDIAGELTDESAADRDEVSEDHGGKQIDRTDEHRDPLDTLRDRYARGELSEAQFERKLELLLETDTIENVEDRYAKRHQSTGEPTEPQPETDRLTERE